MNKISVILLSGLVCGAFVQPVSGAETGTYKEQVLYSFCRQDHCTDGVGPEAGLIDVHGVLYGTTVYGGDPVCGCGTVFSIDPSTGAETVLHSFSGADGGGPEAGLIEVKGRLYGTTVAGGSGGCNGNGCGTVYVIDRKTGKEKVLYSFAGGTDGQQPEAGLIEVNGVLYGTTQTGGTTGFGTVFALDPATGAETVLYSFAGGSDGGGPLAGLIDVDGVLYGTTAYGAGTGCYLGTGCGTVFALDPGSRTETVLYSFSGGADGGNPVAGLVEADGVLYGTTEYGGNTGCDSGCGTVFSLDPATGTETVLHAFTGVPDGAAPVAGLIDVDGVLYGTTELGGSKITCRGRGGCGTAFSVDPATGAETLLYAFCGSHRSCNGLYPEAGLIDVHGKLYGTTVYGATNAYGTVFELKEKRH